LEITVEEIQAPVLKVENKQAQFSLLHCMLEHTNQIFLEKNNRPQFEHEKMLIP